MDNKIVMISIAAVIGIILVGSVLIPILEDSENSMNGIEYNGKGEYCVRMSYGTPTEDLYFTKPAGEMKIECRLGSADADPYYIAPLNAAGQLGWAFCSSTYSLGITGYGPEPMDYTARYNGIGQGGYIDVGNTLTVKVDHTTGHITTWSTDPSSTWDRFDNADVTKMFWADPNGEYINVNSEPEMRTYMVYIENPKAIAGSSQTQANYVFYTDTDSVSVTASKPATITTETTQESNGLYLLTSVPMTITGLDDSVNNVHSGHVIVKYKVVGEPVAGYDGYSALFAAIPVMIILAILLGVVALVIRSRN